MIKLELFKILFPVDYLKDILTPKTNNILKHPMDIGAFIWWLVCWFYIGNWVRILNRKKKLGYLRVTVVWQNRLDNIQTTLNLSDTH